MAQFDELTLLSAVVATTTSRPMSLENYGAGVGFQLQAASISSGNGVFTFEGTVDGTNWVALNVMVDNVTNTNAQNKTRVASKTLSSNTTVIVWLEPEFSSGLKAIRVTVTRTTDGAYTVNAIGKSFK